MSLYEESTTEIYCGLCTKILNPPIKNMKIYSSENSPCLPVCLSCSKHLQKISEVIESHNLKWAELSNKGRTWLATSGVENYMNENQGNIETYMKIEISEDDEEAIKKDVMMGRTDPEIFEWEYHELLKRIMKKTYREDICRVLRAYCARNRNIGYCQGMSYVCMWLLVFMDHNSAFWTLSYLVEKWLLPDFYIGAKHGNSLNGFYIESSTIAGFLNKLIPSIPKCPYPAEQFSDFFSLQVLIQLFVNTVDLEACIFLWDKLMLESSVPLICGVVSLVSISDQEIRSEHHPLNILKQLPEKRIINELSQEYDRLKVEITIKRVEDLRHQAREMRARQWKYCEKLSMKRLQKVSNLNEEEINQIGKIFEDYLQEGVRQSNRYTIKLPKTNQESFDKATYESGIRREDFIKIISDISPHLSASAGLIFDRFDEDKSGLLDFRELTICISIMMKGDFEDKLKICFDVYDADKSGFLQPNEMNDLIESIIKPYRDTGLESSMPGALNIEDIREKLNKICEASGDILCFRDFLLAVKADPALYSCFSSHFKTDEDGIRTLSKQETKKDRMGKTSCKNCRIF
ncbi:hypothetical protein SteCoe_4949 [Stentor coeruleus]|uniref:Rab-GAP TBC domain-containing protein n=1 Tax=Stentor coeruleus TaxID=5963 RepID=A0A1R2CTK9_9CILI|nr:hypothetical protein SteCoe_4949 [Stentor coeruleus]